MPTYQYRCTECGNELEAVQKFTDSALTDCPDCTGQLRKVFNAVGVVFKGSGFYRTDSRADTKVGVGATGAKTEGGSESAEKKSADASSSSDKASGTSEKNSETSAGKQPATAGTGGSSNGSSSNGSSSKSTSSASGSSTAA